jgi:hypothetical protein
MGRQTNGDGTGNGDFFIKYGSDTYGPNNDTVMSFRANGDHKVRIEADKDDVDEEDNPHLVLVQDGTVEKAGFYLEGSAAGQANALSISASDSSGNGILFRAGTSDNAYEGAPIRMKIDGSGNVGVGTVNPVSKLDVSGQVRSVNSSGSSEVNTTATVDWHNGNAQTMNVDCDTTTFSNMLDGGTYILAVSETGTSQCDFSQAGLTFFFSPANGPRESGARTVYTFQRIGSDVYVSWIKGFQ